jgi:hypothetical protein
MSDPEQIRDDDEPFDLKREPLDQPPAPFEIDWGGDGSDLMRPVRAHVLAALRPAAGPYQPPLDALLALGESDDEELERRREELGIGQEHVPELLRMLRDRSLATADGDTPDAWAPIHALHVLAGLDLSAHTAELVPLLDLDFDRVSDELIDMLGEVGEPALAPLEAYVADRSRWVWGRSRAAHGLQKIAEGQPETRDQVVETLSAILRDAEGDHEDAVTGAMTALVDLKAVEALPLIRRAFELGKIDETMNGPWGDVLREIGVEPAPDDPLLEESRRRFEERHRQLAPPDLRENLDALGAQQRARRAMAELQAATQKRKQDKARTEKSKRKAAKASRKANRKKRK